MMNRLFPSRRKDSETINLYEDAITVTSTVVKSPSRRSMAPRSMPKRGRSLPPASAPKFATSTTSSSMSAASFGGESVASTIQGARLSDRSDSTLRIVGVVDTNGPTNARSNAPTRTPTGMPQRGRQRRFRSASPSIRSSSVTPRRQRSSSSRSFLSNRSRTLNRSGPSSAMSMTSKRTPRVPRPGLLLMRRKGTSPPDKKTKKEQEAVDGNASEGSASNGSSSTARRQSTTAKGQKNKKDATSTTTTTNNNKKKSQRNGTIVTKQPKGEQGKGKQQRQKQREAESREDVSEQRESMTSAARLTVVMSERKVYRPSQSQSQSSKTATRPVHRKPMGRPPLHTSARNSQTRRGPAQQSNVPPTDRSPLERQSMTSAVSSMVKAANAALGMATMVAIQPPSSSSSNATANSSNSNNISSITGANANANSATKTDINRKTNANSVDDRNDQESSETKPEETLVAKNVAPLATEREAAQSIDMGGSQAAQASSLENHGNEMVSTNQRQIDRIVNQVFNTQDDESTIDSMDVLYNWICSGPLDERDLFDDQSETTAGSTLSAVTRWYNLQSGVLGQLGNCGH